MVPEGHWRVLRATSGHGAGLGYLVRQACDLSLHSFLFVHGFASIRYLFSCVYSPGYYGPSTAKGGRYTLLPSFLLLKMLLDFQPIYTPLFFPRRICHAIFIVPPVKRNYRDNLSLRNKQTNKQPVSQLSGNPIPRSLSTPLPGYIPPF